MIVDVLGHAADAVAAHFRFAAVGVEHPHPGRGDRRRANQDQPVAAHAKMPIRDAPGQLGRVVRQRLMKAIDVNVVVANAVHLGETHGSYSAVARAGRKPDAPHFRELGQCRQTELLGARQPRKTPAVSPSNPAGCRSNRCYRRVWRSDRSPALRPGHRPADGGGIPRAPAIGVAVVGFLIFAVGGGDAGRVFGPALRFDPRLLLGGRLFKRGPRGGH